MISQLLNLLLFISVGLSLGAKEPVADKNVCCVDHPKKTTSPSYVANYDCSQLKDFGSDRCNEVWGGGTCIWNTGKMCKVTKIKCQRVSYYETHYQHSVDVGRCNGNCKKNKCKVKDYSSITLKTETGAKKVRVIKSCECDSCLAVTRNKIVEIPVGKCKGDCNTLPNNIMCRAGISDDFDVSNGLEISSPSSLLLSGFLSDCSGGVQNGFDVFTNDRCFGHTFTECLQKRKCPLQSGALHICMQAAPVSLTQTDSLILGINGSPLWGKSLPILNGGTWNPGEILCLDLDLDNLPIDGVSILSIVDSVGHLDVGVQDDTAVDYLVLKIQYEECQKCIPVSTSISTLYQDSGITNYVNIKECECVDVSKCQRLELLEVHYPGTKYETVVDKGQCQGGCPRFMRCQPNEVSVGEIDSPEGSKKISKIKSCKCSKIPWNGFADF